jgi:hypothetical protein
MGSGMKSLQLLVSNPLHIFEQNLLPGAVVKFGRSTVCMTGNPLSHLQRSSILQEIGLPVALKEWGANSCRQR